MPDAYLKADFKDIHTKPKAVVPTLEIEAAFTLSKTGDGVSLNISETTGLTVTGIVPSLYWREGAEGDWTARLVAVGFMGYTSGANVLRVGEGTFNCRLVFPLSSETVSRIEALRNGRKAKFRVALRVTGLHAKTFEVFVPPKSTTSQQVYENWFAQHVRTEIIQVPFFIDSLNLMTGRGEGNMDIEVDKSRWAEDILPDLGFGVWKTYEIPVSDLAALGKVDEYVEQAAKNFNTGDWKDSLARSRDAVQALEPYLRKYGNPVYDDKKGTAAEKFADMTASFSNLTSSMYDFQAKVFSLLSAGAHPESSGATVERADAELGLSVVMACRRYVGARASGPKIA